MTVDQADEILKELVMLRKLRIMELVKQGVSQGELAKALGVSQPTVSRMMPKTVIRKAILDE